MARIRFWLCAISLFVLLVIAIRQWTQSSASEENEQNVDVIDTSSADIDWLSSDKSLVPAPNASVNYAVHAFYYGWYGAPEHNQLPNRQSHWVHWNHPLMRNWFWLYFHGYPMSRHRPPDDIGASFYPKLGPYASVDTEIINAHLRMSQFAGIGVWALSWYPSGMADENGEPVDPLVLPILDLASKYGIKVCLHIEPYSGRSASSIVRVLQYALDHGYTSHPAYYRLPTGGAQSDSQSTLPVFFIYDSYKTSANEWSSILTKTGSNSIRGKPYDAYLIGLLMKHSDCDEFGRVGFNGGYTYFVGAGTTSASSPNSWKSLANQCRKFNVDFYPSIGPGYDDRAIRPWNNFNTVVRSAGSIYNQAYQLAKQSAPSGFGITSFNEWGEGSQIEPAKPAHRASSAPFHTKYLDYSPYSSDYYLRLTRLFINDYSQWKSLPTHFSPTIAEEKHILDTIQSALITS